MSACSGSIRCVEVAEGRYGVANGDMDADDIRKSLKPLQDKEKLWNQLPAKFEECLNDFHPVMRHFFTEKHRDPMTWFTMRLNYTRSVAVTSIIGWILGVGDRHCSNILIDQKTGELVHIDFGIVFEDVSIVAASGFGMAWCWTREIG